MHTGRRVSTLVLVAVLTGCSSGSPEAVWTAYLDAHNAGRTEDELALYTEDAVFEIPGVTTFEGRDEVADLVAWDAAVHSHLEVSGYTVEGDTLTIERITESNGWFRAVGIEAVEYLPGSIVRVEGGRIAEVRPASLTEESVEAVEQAMGGFVAWARAHPDAPLDALMPEGRFVYGAESARRWMTWFDAWKAATAGVRLPEGAVLVDLTYAFGEDTVYWPTSPHGFVLERLHYGPTGAGFFYAANRFEAPEHGGTHLDAPIHFAEGKHTADAIPLDRLVAPAVVIDLPAGDNPDALLEPSHVEAFEQAHGPIAAGEIALVRTGWGERWPDRARYLGDDTSGDASNLHFPGISEAGARTLLDRGVAAVGIDTASIDHGPSTDFIAHQVLMADDVPAFENVANLERLPPRGALVIALPMKISGGSGGPLRIVAVVPE